MIRLELNHCLMQYYTELDCIMLCGVRNRPAWHDYPALRAEAARLQTPVSLESGLPEEVVSMPAWDQEEDEGLVKGLELLQVAEVSCCPNEENPELFEMLPVCRFLFFLSFLMLPVCRVLFFSVSQCRPWVDSDLQWVCVGTGICWFVCYYFVYFFLTWH